MGRTPIYHAAMSATRYVSFERVNRNRVHRHSFFEPCIVATGSGEFEHDGVLYPLRAGDLFIADPGIYHEIRSLTSRDLGLYFLAFNVTRSSAGPWSTERRGVNQVAMADFILGHRAHASGQWQLLPLFEHALKLSHHERNQQHSAFYTDVASLLVDQIVAALAQSSVAPTKQNSDELLMARVVNVIEQRLHERLPIAALAKECGTSERTLRRRWKKCGERSLTDEINQRRVARASHLLLLPDISVAQVGYQVGIESPARFARLFRKMRGQAPRSFRRQYLGRPPDQSSGGPPFRTEFLDGDIREYDR